MKAFKIITNRNMRHSKHILLVVLVFHLIGCGSSNPIPELISMFTNFNKQELSEIPQGSNQIVIVKNGIKPNELYHIILDQLIENEYRVVVALENKYILGSDFDGKKERNIGNSMHRFDVHISDTDSGAVAVFTGEYKSFGSFGESSKIASAVWNTHTEPSYYFAIILDFARSIPEGDIFYAEVHEED